MQIDWVRSWKLGHLMYAQLVTERDELYRELAAMKAARDEALAALTELRVAVQERWKAEERLAQYYRERNIQRAQAVVRDWSDTLH
jgi:hypothetical protein